jgi:hypothetical protein
LKDRRTESIETKELKDPLAVEVEHSQNIGLVQTALDSLKMPAVALSDTGTSKATNFANPFVLELLEELRIVQGLVRRENEQRTAGLTIPPSLPARACEAIE